MTASARAASGLEILDLAVADRDAPLRQRFHERGHERTHADVAVFGDVQGRHDIAQRRLETPGRVRVDQLVPHARLAEARRRGREALRFVGVSATCSVPERWYSVAWSASIVTRSMKPSYS